MSKHTPGKVVKWQGFDAEGHVVVESIGKPAQVRTAAPELLAALEALLSMDVKGHSLLDRLQFSTDGRALSEKCLAAIAKAKTLQNPA